MNTTAWTKRTWQTDTLTLFGLACLAYGGLTIAVQLVLFFRQLELPSNGTTIRDAAMHVWTPWIGWNGFLACILLVGGVGLLRRRSWGWWLVLGFCLMHVGSVIVRAVDDIHPAITAALYVQQIVSAVYRILYPTFSIVLLIFLLLPSTRAAVCRVGNTPEVNRAGTDSKRAAAEVRVMGWALLLLAVRGAIYASLILPTLWQSNDALGTSPNASADSKERHNVIRTHPKSVVVFANIFETVCPAVVGYGLLGKRLWARRGTQLFASLWLAAFALAVGYDWIMALAYPMDSPSSRPSTGIVVHTASALAIILKSLSDLIFPVLLLSFARLPHVRQFLSLTASAPSEDADSVA